jgi:hypothetical protein
MIELEHSPLGGSAAHRFMNCEGSFLLQREQIENGTFENIESEYAKLGTAAHLLGSTCLIEGKEPYEFIGTDFLGYRVGWPDGVPLDAVQVYVNECRSIIERCDADGVGLIEETFHLPQLHPLLRGTVDFGYISPSKGIFLRDYKNGEGIGVSAPNNDQLRYYGFILIEAARGNCPFTPETPVSLGIVQPNFYGIFEEADVWETTVGEILDWGHKILLPRMNFLTETGKYALEDEFSPGKWCQFCPVLLNCPKMQKAFEEFAEASEDFIAMLTNEELDHYYQQKEYARRFMNALDQTVLARKITGADIPSAKLVEKKTARVWKPGAHEVLKKTFGDKAFTQPEIRSPAQIEKLSSRGKEIALEYAYKPEASGLTVAPLDDPRPEAKPRTNADVFAAHAQTPEQMGF